MNDVTVGLQDAGLQPLPDQVQECPVIDAQTQHLQQPVVAHVVEEAFDVRLHDAMLPARAVECRVSDSVTLLRLPPKAVHL